MQFRSESFLFLNKSSISIFLVSIMFVFSSSLYAADEKQVWLLDKAISAATAVNPDYMAAHVNAEALAISPDIVGTLPDPQFSINMLNLPVDSFSLSQEGMTQLQLGLTQQLPFPGKLSLRSQVARHEADVSEAHFLQAQLKLVRDVKTTWWSLFYLDRTLDVIKRNQNLLAQIVNVAETRYQVGKGLQQDILLAQLEVSKLRDKSIRFKRERKNTQIHFNVLLNRPTNTTVHLPETVDETLTNIKSYKQLLQLNEKTHPVMKSQLSRIEAATSRVSLAKKGYAPDFKLGAVYGLRSGDNIDNSQRADFASIMLSMNLPLYANKKQARIVDQRKSELLKQSYLLADYRNRVTADISQAISDYQFGVNQTKLFKEEIVPQARQTVDSMLAGYQSDKVDFLSLIRSQTMLYDYETQYWKALSAANQAMARLVAAVGEENIHE